MQHETDVFLNFEQTLAAGGCPREWLLGLIEEEVIVVQGQPEHCAYSGFQLARIRRATRIGRDFEASIPATALIMRLLDELEELRKSQPALAE